VALADHSNDLDDDDDSRRLVGDGEDLKSEGSHLVASLVGEVVGEEYDRST